MQLGKEHKRQVEEIISAMECPKDFVCHKSEFENLTKVRIIGDAKLVECLPLWSMNLSSRICMAKISDKL